MSLLVAILATAPAACFRTSTLLLDNKFNNGNNPLQKTISLWFFSLPASANNALAA